jgi:outer membrane protein insertion porin family
MVDGFFLYEDSLLIDAMNQPKSLGTNIRLFLLLYLAECIVGMLNPARAQEHDSITVTRWEIATITFQGNTSFSDESFRDLIHTKESAGSISQFLFRTLGDKFGSKPEYFDPDIVSEDVHRLIDFYRSEGYYRVEVSNQNMFDSTRATVDVLFMLKENRRSYIDSIFYSGLDSLPTEVRSKLFTGSLIHPGIPYQTEKSSAEIIRVLNTLADNGYAIARYDPTNSAAYHILSSGNFILKMAFVLGKRFPFGAISVVVDPPREDLTTPLTLRHLDFKPGDLYSRDKIISSERNLNRLGLFESARIDHPPVVDSSSDIPIEVMLRPLPRNDLSPEILVSDESGFFNLGVGLGFTNRNFFGDARMFDANARVRTQDIHRWDFYRVFHGKGLRDPSVRGTVELEFQILQPYFFSKNLTATWTSSISAEKQTIFILSILRNKIGLSNQFATFTYGYVDWTLERVSPEFLQDTAEAQAILNAKRDEDRPQFNSILTFTLQRDKTNNLFSPTEGFFSSITIEESGLLPHFLPGARTGLPYTQYYKVTMLGRWYKDLTSRRFNILAWKLRSGYQNKYGESKYSSVPIPLNRRFFAGGSGSIRGWRARELGAMPSELIQLGGNFIFEGSVEMRVSHFQGFGKFLFLKLENLLGVYFLDIGNVWSDVADFRINSLAAAAGVGLRYETFFGPFRIDYGFRLYDPAASPGSQTIFQKRFFGETLKNGVLNFGIGHAF